MSERFMKNFNGEEVFSLEYDKETLRDMVIEKQEEIKDLKKQLEEEKNAYNRMYNMYVEVKERNEKALEYGDNCINKSLDLDALNEPYKSVFEACYEIHERYKNILKGEDKSEI